MTLEDHEPEIFFNKGCVIGAAGSGINSLPPMVKGGGSPGFAVFHPSEHRQLVGQPSKD